MSKVFGGRVGPLALAGIITACSAGCSAGSDSLRPKNELELAGTGPAFASSGTTSKLLARSTFSDPNDQNFKVMRITGDWHVEIKAKPAFDIAVQSIVFEVGGQSGWHVHPGPVFIQVVKGSMTFYESDDPTCTPKVLTAGQGFLDVGDHAHIARNESGAPAENIVTYFVPPGATALRKDTDPPGNCPF
ncbi:MAG TPA: cupin domain-containing protein [Gemmatimonadaceae bacterium]|nr:cupin domain-containing protein [Gemmatimonadaceae bacterium]